MNEPQARTDALMTQRLASTHYLARDTLAYGLAHFVIDPGRRHDERTRLRQGRVRDRTLLEQSGFRAFAQGRRSQPPTPPRG